MRFLALTAEVRMGCEPLSNEESSAWRDLLSRFADDSDRDRRLVDLLVTVKAEPLDSAERKKAIAKIVVELDNYGGLMWKGVNIGKNRLSVKYIQKIQKDLDAQNDKLSQVEFARRQQSINALWEQLTEQQALVIDWMGTHIQEFKPDFQDKYGNYIGKSVAGKLCHWTNKKLKFLRLDAEKDRRKETDELSLNTPCIEDDESGKTYLDNYCQNMEDLNNWANEEPKKLPASKIWKYVAEDPERKLQKHTYKNGLNYQDFALRLRKSFQEMMESNQQEKIGGEESAKTNDKMADRIIIKIIDQIADEFNIKPSTLRSHYYRKFKPFFADLGLSLCENDEDEFEGAEDV